MQSRIRAYTEMRNTNKANSENPNLKFVVDSTNNNYWTLRVAGGNRDTLSLVYYLNNVAKYFYIIGDKNGVIFPLTSLAITQNSAYISTNTGNAWGFYASGWCVITFYLHIKYDFQEYSSYKILSFSGDMKSSASVKGIAMTQTNGITHILEINNNDRSVYLTFKGEPRTSDDYLWGQVVFPVTHQ